MAKRPSTKSPRAAKRRASPAPRRASLDEGALPEWPRRDPPLPREDRWRWGLPYLPRPLPAGWRVVRADTVVVAVEVEGRITFELGGLTNAAGYDLMVVTMNYVDRHGPVTTEDARSILRHFPTLDFEDEPSEGRLPDSLRTFVAFVDVDEPEGLASSVAWTRNHMGVMERARALLKSAFARAMLEAKPIHEYALVVRWHGGRGDERADDVVLRRDEAEEDLMREGDPDDLRGTLDAQLGDNEMLVLVVRRGSVSGMVLEWDPGQMGEVLR